MSFIVLFQDIKINESFLFENCPFTKIDENYAIMMGMDRDNKEYFRSDEKVVKLI